eukprot:292917-Pleurochrysis_carterae.AAC.1
MNITLIPGETGTGAEPHATVQVTFNTDESGGNEEQGVVMRCEVLRIVKVRDAIFFLPQQLDVPSLTLALKFEGRLVFSYNLGSMHWVNTERRIDVTSLRSSVKGSSHSARGMSEMVMHWMVEKMLPGALQRAVLRRLPAEVGQYLLSARDTCELRMRLRFSGTPLAGLLAKLGSGDAGAVTPSVAASMDMAAAALEVEPAALAQTLQALRSLRAVESAASAASVSVSGSDFSLLGLLHWRRETLRLDEE